MTCVVIEEGSACTSNVCSTEDGVMVTVTSQAVATAITTSARAEAKPAAVYGDAIVARHKVIDAKFATVSLTDSRCAEDPESCVTIFVEGMRAPVASCTVPRRVP